MRPNRLHAQALPLMQWLGPSKSSKPGSLLREFGSPASEAISCVRSVRDLAPRRQLGLRPLSDLRSADDRVLSQASPPRLPKSLSPYDPTNHGDHCPSRASPEDTPDWFRRARPRAGRKTWRPTHRFGRATTKRHSNCVVAHALRPCRWCGRNQRRPGMRRHGARSAAEQLK